MWRARDVGFVESGADARPLHMSLQARECRHHLVYVSPTRSPDLRFGTRIVAALRLRCVSEEETLRLETHPDIYNLMHRRLREEPQPSAHYY